MPMFAGRKKIEYQNHRNFLELSRLHDAESMAGETFPVPCATLDTHYFDVEPR